MYRNKIVEARRKFPHTTEQVGFRVSFAEKPIEKLSISTEVWYMMKTESLPPQVATNCRFLKVLHVELFYLHFDNCCQNFKT